MSNVELDELAQSAHDDRVAAVFALCSRARTDHAAAQMIGELFDLRWVQELRYCGRFPRPKLSLAWALVEELLATDDPETREIGYAAYARLASVEQEDVLVWLGVDRIEDYHRRTGD
ncbi:hypothetical protein [Cryptosporangium sp. NPDC051539]|uniref:hypothetical protein n=1 Tax=Cryptosporangium sp. NPDC051539 TaxID=3363962 RepID=UPI0037B59CE6